MSDLSGNSEVDVLQGQVNTLRRRSQNTSNPPIFSNNSSSSMSRTFKIALIGPKQSGKTKIANQIADVDRKEHTEYQPTAGVRILELDEHLEDGSRAKVQLWDCSGDQKYESCWSAIVDKLDGCLVCFDPLDKSQANDVRIWTEWFVKRANLSQGQAAIFCHGELSVQHKPLSVRASLNSDGTIPVPIINVSTSNNNQAADADGNLPETVAHKEFNQFLQGVIQTIKNRN